MVQETGVQSQVKSYQRLKKWYLMPPCLALSIIRYISRIKWSNPGNRVAPSSTPQCSSYWKRSSPVTLDSGCQLYLLYLWIETVPMYLLTRLQQCWRSIFQSCLMLLSEIMWRLQVQAQLQLKITRNTYNNLYPVMINRIGTVYPCGSKKGDSLRFSMNHETPGESQRIYRPKHGHLWWCNG